MPSPLFQFELHPVDQIQPWGGPADPNLDWFGLTGGQYWIQAGAHRLFEYSKAAQARSNVPRFCDYQIVRLYEDVIGLAPNALEPVPEELRRYISLDESKPWNHYWAKWCESMDAIGASQDAMSLLDDAGPWIGRRTLDSAYLTPSANIVLWSDQDSVHIQWDNRNKLLQECQAWSTQFGSWQLPRAKFMDEVRSFHDRLMEQMAQRISQVEAGALTGSVRLDLEGLRREQHIRSQPIERNLGQPIPPTDWPLVIAAIRSLEAVRPNPSIEGTSTSGLRPLVGAPHVKR
jgi:hypothetical protein